MRIDHQNGLEVQAVIVFPVVLFWWGSDRHIGFGWLLWYWELHF